MSERVQGNGWIPFRTNTGKNVSSRHHRACGGPVKRVVVLGGGIGGVIAARELSRKLDGQAEVTLVDKEGHHSFPPSYPWLAMGWREPEQLSRPLRNLRVRDVIFRTAEVVGLHPDERKVATTAGDLTYDYLLISLGAQLDHRAIEGFGDGAHHFYDLEGATRLRDALRAFRGGKVVIGVSRLPFKCPAAPYEGALLMDYAFRKRGIRDNVEMEFFTPEPWPTPSAGEAIGKAVQRLLEERGIPVHAKWEMTHVDPKSRLVHFKGGAQLPYDLLVAVPPHTTCTPARESGLAKDGPWIPVNRYTMRTGYDDVYAVGDVAKIPTPTGNVPVLPKAGVFAEGQAKVAAANIAAEIAGGEGSRWNGYGICFLETGRGKAGMVRGNFFKEGPPEIRMRRPSRIWHWGKVLFERRWLGGLFR